jgi:transcriptional regulator with XRE-family HTH domain
MATNDDEDPVMAKVRAALERSGMSLAELGRRMGYPAETGRQAVWQFLRSGDPRIGTLRRFADATGTSFGELVAAPKKARAKK